MSKFTPGPWHLHPSGMANLLGEFTVFFGSGETATNQICQTKQHNARLIAAAPEMYEILEEMFLYVLPTGSDKEKIRELLKRIDG